MKNRSTAPECQGEAGGAAGVVAFLMQWPASTRTFVGTVDLGSGPVSAGCGPQPFLLKFDPTP
jgi:hypothetical protein